MASNVVPLDPNKLPAELQDVFNTEELAGDLYDNLAAGFSVVSFRGSKWRIKSGGNEEPILNDKDDPVASIEVVILKGSKKISKIYYKEAYTEGDDAAPDCWSVDGETPDPGSPHKQSETCASCPHNIWGSKITPQGKKTKACADSRRVAVAPLGDIINERFGGPMLLRIPAASLADLAAYGKGMAQKGFPYNCVATRIGFDLNASYPKLTFRPIRALTEDELKDVAVHLREDKISAILDTASEHVASTKPAKAPPAEVPQEPVSLDFEEPPVDPPKAEPKPEKKPQKKAEKKAESKPKEAADSEDESTLDKELDDIMKGLDNLM